MMKPDAPWPILRGWQFNPAATNYESEEEYLARVNVYIADMKRVAKLRGYVFDPVTGLYKKTDK